MYHFCPKSAPEVVLFYTESNGNVTITSAMINGDFISQYLFKAAFIDSNIRWETEIEDRLKTLTESGVV